MGHNCHHESSAPSSTLESCHRCTYGDKKQINFKDLSNTWDLDCNTNLINDISDEYAFAEDRGSLFSATLPFQPK